MSYIHDALKKAQKEKDFLTGKYADLWATYRPKRQMLRREWLVSASLILAAIVFSAYSWLHSLARLPSSNHEQSPAVYRQAVRFPDRLTSGKGRGLPLHEDVPNSRETGVKRKPAKKPLPGRKDKDREERAQQALQTLPQSAGSGNALTLYRRALALQKKGQLPEARRLYEDAIKRSPHLASALNNLGTIYIREKKHAAARRVLEKAIRIDPDYVDPYYNLACLHALEKDVGRSLFYLKKAISVDQAVRKWARADEDLQNLRGHSEYEKIMHGPEKS